MGHLLGIDVGTSATKALLLTPDGHVAGSARASCEVGTPRPGWSEQHPAAWWETVRTAARTRPRPRKVRLHRRLHAEYAKLYPALRGSFHALAELS